LEDDIYLDCKEQSDNYDKVTPFWNSLALKYGYDDAERLRSAFRLERRNRGDDLEKPSNPENFNVVIFDIETLPLKSYTWGVWKQNISPVQLIDDWVMLSWASKDLMRGEIRSQIMTPKEALARDDKRISEGLWTEFDRANILIGHNATDFDVPKAKTRFLFHGMLPPSPFRIIDTLKIAKYNFRFTYNKLGYLNDYLGITRKLDNEGFALWQKCANGDPEALATMLEYNEGDIGSSEELYLALRAWDDRHPQIGLYFDDVETRCRNCGSTNLKNLDKPYTTNLGVYQSVRCNNCGAIGRRPTNKLSKEKRMALLR